MYISSLFLSGSLQNVMACLRPHTSLGISRQGRPHVVKPWTDSDDDNLDDANDDDEVTALAVSSSNDIK